MKTWTYEDLERMLEAFSNADGGNDPKTRKRQRIIQAATDLFIQHGYRKTSVDEVAHRAGVAKGTVYLYFKTKAELLTQAIVEEKKRYLIEIKPVLEAPPAERLQRYIRLAPVVIQKMPLLSKLMSGDREVMLVFEEMDSDVRQQVLDMQTTFMAGLLSAATEKSGLPQEELLDRAKVLIGLLYSFGIISDERVRKGLSIDRFASILADIITYGVSAPSRRGDE
jgi:AcrR family transcriptional regulator